MHRGRGAAPSPDAAGGLAVSEGFVADQNTPCSGKKKSTKINFLNEGGVVIEKLVPSLKVYFPWVSKGGNPAGCPRNSAEQLGCSPMMGVFKKFV